MSTTKKRKKAYRPRSADGIKLKMQPWKVSAVMDPLLSILDQLEKHGTIDVAGKDAPVFRDAVDGDWYHSPTAIMGVVEAYEIHERRTGVDLHLDGLRRLAKALQYDMPINGVMTAAARLSLSHIRAATLEMTAGYARDLVKDFQIMEALQEIPVQKDA